MPLSRTLRLLPMGALLAIALLAGFTLGLHSRVSPVIASSHATGAAPEQAAATAGWTWPGIPRCLADPALKTSGLMDPDASICTLYDQLLASGESDIELRSARHINAEMDEVLYPAFTPGTEVVTFITAETFNKLFTGSRRLVRVSSGAGAASSGSWWTTSDMVSEDGHLLGADAIRAKLALLSSPACIAYADEVRPGVRAYMGVVAPAFGQPGGGTEFWFPPRAVVAKKRIEGIGGGACAP